MTSAVVSVSNTTAVVSVSSPPAVVVEGSTGAVPAGTGYTHEQTTPAVLWTIDHPLSWRPNVEVVDETGATVLATVDHVSATRITVTHAVARIGAVYLS